VDELRPLEAGVQLQAAAWRSSLSWTCACTVDETVYQAYTEGKVINQIRVL
jgi:hypothetical protein